MFLALCTASKFDRTLVSGLQKLRKFKISTKFFIFQINAFATPTEPKTNKQTVLYTQPYTPNNCAIHSINDNRKMQERRMREHRVAKHFRHPNISPLFLSTKRFSCLKVTQRSEGTHRLSSILFWIQLFWRFSLKFDVTVEFLWSEKRRKLAFQGLWKNFIQN